MEAWHTTSPGPGCWHGPPGSLVGFCAEAVGSNVVDVADAVLVVAISVAGAVRTSSRRTRSHRRLNSRWSRLVFAVVALAVIAISMVLAASCLFSTRCAMPCLRLCDVELKL